MDQNRQKNTAQWFFENFFKPETIPSRPAPSAVKLPAPLRAARSLNLGATDWQSRTLVFLKQAKLLANFEDDCPYDRPVTHYFPTYESLSDPELRGYFTWRTRLRQGQTEKTSFTYAILYVYELLNQIGVRDPLEGYQKLLEFHRAYRQLDEKLDIYLENWLRDYVIYYGLDPVLLQGREDTRRDCALSILADVENRNWEQLLPALEVLAPSWLGRSRFFKDHREDMGRVLLLTLQGFSQHFAKYRKKTMVEEYFGIYREYPVRLFDTAVFRQKPSQPDREFWVSPVRVYRCRKGLWSVYAYSDVKEKTPELEALIKAVDAAMRPHWGGKAIQGETVIKWQKKCIDTAIAQVLEENRAAQAKKLTLDYSRLAAIRTDADQTREKLAVEEELWTEPEPEPVALPKPAPIPEPSPELPLTPQEIRFLRCLLYGGSLDWVRREGLMPSVLTDSINEALYDTFADSVLDPDGGLIEDYMEDLKEMVQP